MNNELATSPAFIYNEAQAYFMEIDLPKGMTVDEAFDYAYAVAVRNGAKPGEFGIEVRQAEEV